MTLVFLSINTFAVFDSRNVDENILYALLQTGPEKISGSVRITFTYCEVCSTLTHTDLLVYFSHSLPRWGLSAASGFVESCPRNPIDSTITSGSMRDHPA